MPESILRTKLRIPPLRSHLVPRPALNRQLNQGLQAACKLTLISAPAGFGKTTLAASFVASCGLPAAWLSLDHHDNQDGRFLNYLAAALQEADGTLGRDAAQLLNVPQQAQPEVILANLINDLHNLPTAMILVLDDYQAISQQTVHEEVAFLLEQCPETFHVLLTTRADPPLPLARLRARGQMVELRAADLRFTEAEAAQFLNNVMGLHLDAASIAMLEERTEGWIAGLQLAALSMHGREDRQGFISGFSGTNRFILDYLLEEVLASQPPEVKHFLLVTSVLDELTAPLCEALLDEDESPFERDTGRSRLKSRSVHNAQAIMAYLEKTNLFLVPLDDERIWYRYHHLFADLLRAQLGQINPTLAPRLHRQAAAWLEQNGLISQAVQQLVAARAVEKAAGLIARYGPAQLAGGDPSLLQMAESLPQETILACPKTGLYQAWLLIVRGRIVKAGALLNNMAQQLASSARPTTPRWMQTIISTALAFLYPAGNRAKLPAQELLAEIPAGEPILANAANFLYAMALGRQGELDRAVLFADACVQKEKRSQRLLAIPTLAPFLCRGLLMQGHLHAAADLCHEYLDPIRERDFRLMVTTGSMKIDLGEALLEWNRLETAEQLIRDGLQDNEPWGNIMTDSFGQSALIRVLQAKGDFAGALQAVERFETRLQGQFRPREFEEDRLTLRVRVQLASGDRLSPAMWADQIELSEDFTQREELYRLTLAHIRLVQGRYADVEKMLAGKAPAPATGSRISKQLASDLLLAGAVAGQQRRQEALALVESTLAAAEPEGYLRVFLDLGQPARELLSAYVRSEPAKYEAFARQILAAMLPSASSGPPGRQESAIVEPLTERELEVLQSMAQGMTNRQIAQRLIVAPGTVKAHTASIYRKLDVANRTEAAARARELGILS